MPRKPPTKAERERMAKIAQMPCCVCGDYPTEVHHITQCGRRLGHKFTIPLCINCHRGNNGFSGINRSAWNKSLDNQLKLLEEVNNALSNH